MREREKCPILSCVGRSSLLIVSVSRPYPRSTLNYLKNSQSLSHPNTIGRIIVLWCKVKLHPSSPISVSFIISCLTHFEQEVGWISDFIACFCFGVGLYLSDLTFINDGNSTLLRDGKVNWKKMTKLASILQKIQIAQSSDYQFLIQPDPDLQNFLCTELYILDEKELYKRSRLLEPPDFQGSKK
jgi:hypothetical protein